MRRGAPPSSASGSASASSVLERRPLPSSTVRADKLPADPFHQPPQPVGIEGFVGDEPAGQPSGLRVHVGEGRDDQLHLGGRCGGKGASHRKTLSVRHHHPLRSLSLLGLSDAEPPFLAGAKLPPMKHSSQSRVAMNTLQTASHTPSSSQSRSLRQQVTGAGRCLGMSRHLAPVLSIQSIPSRTSRSDSRMFSRRKANAYCAPTPRRSGIRRPCRDEIVVNFQGVILKLSIFETFSDISPFNSSKTLA